MVIKHVAGVMMVIHIVDSLSKCGPVLLGRYAADLWCFGGLGERIGEGDQMRSWSWQVEVEYNRFRSLGFA